ncbi:MAG: CPBP family intramembrane metalloprotease [Flammeovirgaceae bacterium]|nr:CPBP family intramembrane metalloprotease [Flammeovirgaceae bacterium]
MNELDPNYPSAQRSSWISVLLILMVMLGGFLIVGPLIGMVLAIPFMEGSIMDILEMMQRPTDHPELKIPLFIIQGVSTFIGLVVGPWIFFFIDKKKSARALFVKPKVFPIALLMTGIVVIFFMVPNSAVIEWNANLTFPSWLNGFDQWARSREDMAAEITTFLTTFDSLGEFIFAFLVVAVLPALGEELVFRGMLQREIQKGTNNIHAAIWISAILFSALHMQFFGFIPRILLGALFGYLYFWSGNLIVPVFAHFVNNGFSLIMLYLYQLDIVTVDMESAEAAPSYAIGIFTLLTFGLLILLKKNFESLDTRT